jgi:hypothetical protein
LCPIPNGGPESVLANSGKDSRSNFAFASG